MIEPIKPGQTVYSRDGQKYHVREILQNNRLLVSAFLVAEGWEGEEQEYIADSAMVKVASEMCPEPPRAIIDGDISAAQAKLADLRRQQADALKAANEAETHRLAAVNRLAELPKVGRLLDYIDDKITHFVCSDYQRAFTVKTWAELAIYQENKRDKGVKLLTLFGDSNGNTEWRLNAYRDGSGVNHTVIPCFSEEEAVRVVGEQLEAVWLDWEPSRAWVLAGAINSARAYGFPIPADIEAAFKAHSDASHRRSIEKMKADLAAAEAEYAAFREQAA